MEKLDLCPKCNSELRMVEKSGSDDRFPIINISCSNRFCSLDITCTWDSLSEKNSKECIINKMLIKWKIQTD